MESEKDIVETKISQHDFYFETSLYEVINISDVEDTSNIMGGSVDGYNSTLNSSTTYEIERSGIDTWIKATGAKDFHGNEITCRVGYYLITLKCVRRKNHVLRFIVFSDTDIIVKVGQMPSLASLQFSEIGKKYDKILGQEDLSNYKKAIGLYAHGAGAGSFVYLRRIFEKLIAETYNLNKESIELVGKEFKFYRMDEKVDLLREFLPSQLVEMKVVYSILSKGVHELDEETCLKYFAPIKLSIELILDEKIESKLKREKDQKVKDQLVEIKSELSEVDNSTSSQTK